MRETQIQPDAFTMMTDPEAILQAVEASERLSRLQRRICRPLDRPLIPKKGSEADLNAYDREIDLAEEDTAALGD